DPASSSRRRARLPSANYRALGGTCTSAQFGAAGRARRCPFPAEDRKWLVEGQGDVINPSATFASSHFEVANSDSLPPIPKGAGQLTERCYPSGRFTVRG